MKIEKPKCEEFVLFLASQSQSQRVVVKGLSECVRAEDLEATLAGITFWPWDRGDLLCWASVLNLFDDYLLLYVVNSELGERQRFEIYRETLSKGVSVSGIPSDNLILSILNITYFILFNSSSRWIYNSSGLLIALLDSFNPEIVCGALQCLCLVYSSLRNKRRPVDFPFSNDILLRLPFLCASPVPDFKEHQNREFQDHTGATNAGRRSINEHIQSSSFTPSAVAETRPIAPSNPEWGQHRDVSENESNFGSKASEEVNVDEIYPIEELPGEFLKLYSGKFELDENMLKKRCISIVSNPRQDGNMGRDEESRSITYLQLLNGFSPQEISRMSLNDISKEQYKMFRKIAYDYDHLRSSPGDEHDELREAQLQEVRQKLRHLWWCCHEEGRQRLVDIRLVAFSTMIAVNPQFFLNYLGTCSTLLTDLAFLLRHHLQIHARTLCYVLDLWTAIIQDDLQRRNATFLLGLSSPHGLFPTLVLKFLGAFIKNDKTIPIRLACASEASPVDQTGFRVEKRHQGPSVGGGQRIECPGTSLCDAFSSQNDGGGTEVQVHKGGGCESECTKEARSDASPSLSSSASSIAVLPEEKCIASSFFTDSRGQSASGFSLHKSDFNLFLNPGCSQREHLQLQCKVLEHLMELILSVKVTSVFPLTAISHTTILQCLVEFAHVLDPVFLPVVIRICRIFESMVEVVPAVEGVLDILASACNTLQLRLQYEVVKIASLPTFDPDATRISDDGGREFEHLVDTTYRDNRYRHWTASKAHLALQDLTSSPALEVLKLIQEITHRRSLVYFIFRQLDSCVHGTNPDFTRRVVDLYSGPCCLASRFIFQRPFNFGLAVYGVAATLLGDYLAEDPSAQPTLVSRSLIPDFLNSVTEHVLPSEDALQAISVCLTSILLHNSGDSELQKLNYGPIYTIIGIVTREEVVGFDRVGELMTIMGNRLGDAAKNQEKAEHHIIEATLKMVKSIADLAWQLPRWHQVSPGETERIMNEYLDRSSATIKDLSLPDIPPSRYLADRLANMARFLQAMLRSFKMVMLFINGKGADYVLQSATAPSLPPLFLKVLPHHPLNGFIRMLATSGADLSMQNVRDNVHPLFVRRMVDTIPQSVSSLSLLPRLAAHLKNCEKNQLDTTGTDSLTDQDIATLLKSISDLDMALYLILATNKDTSSYTMTLSSIWKRGQHLPFVKLACHTFIHLYKAFPLLLHFLYRHVKVYPTDTLVVLSARHSCHEHPGVRASRKYLPPGSLPLQATKFFWSSLSRFAFSVPNPCFEIVSPHPNALLDSVNCTLTLFFEMVRSTSIQCRLVMSLASRFINKVTMGRARVYQTPNICVDRYATAAYIALAARELLQQVPEVPLSQTPYMGILAYGPHYKETIEPRVEQDANELLRLNQQDYETASYNLTIPGHNPFQTSRYISEVMDILFRLHVNERSEGCLFTLTFDTFYKSGGVLLVLRGFHYCFALLTAMVVCSVRDTHSKKEDELLEALGELLAVTNPRFMPWIKEMVRALDDIPKESFKAACDIASKCLHCCISYCEKITSWKRLYNSLITDYLHKASGATHTSESTLNFVSENTTSDHVSLTQSVPHSSISSEDRSGNSVSIGVGSSYVKTSSLFSTCLPPCGSGGASDFDEAVLLRSIQCEITRQMFSWIEGIFGMPSYRQQNVCYNLLYQSLMSYFSTKAINCLVKICFHFLDAECPNRKNGMSWKEDTHRRVTPTQRQQQNGVSTETESCFCDSLDQLVERQLSGSSQLHLELPEVDKNGTSNISNTTDTLDINANDTRMCQKMDVCVQTDIHYTLGVIHMGLRDAKHADDWSEAACASLLDHMRNRAVDMFLDVASCMLNQPTVVAEIMMRLVSLVLPLGPSDYMACDDVTASQDSTFHKRAERLKPNEYNAHYITHCLVKRLDDIYDAIASMDDEMRNVFFEISWFSTTIPNDTPKSDLAKENCIGEVMSPSQIFGIVRETAGSTIASLESGAEKEGTGVNLIFHTRRIHQALHCYLYLLVNLLHRSSLVRQVFIAKKPEALHFFYQFVALIVRSRKEMFLHNSFKYTNFRAFYGSVTPELGVNNSEPSAFLSSVTVPTWCLQPCKPFLLVNSVAEKAVNNCIAAQFKENLIKFDPNVKLPLSVYHRHPNFPFGSETPEWFNCCFLGIEMTLLLYELDHPCSSEFPNFVHRKRSSRLVPVELQTDLINLCLDVIYFFPGLNGALTTVVLNLLVHLTSIVSNASQLLAYKPTPDMAMPGGGLAILLRLPRTAHFMGILRLMSAILFNVCENRLTFQLRFKKELSQYISSQGVLKKFVEQCSTASISSRSETLQEGVFNAVGQERHLSTTKQEDDSAAAGKEDDHVTIGEKVIQSSGEEKNHELNEADGEKGVEREKQDNSIPEHRVVPLDALLVNLYIYLRRDPHVFKKVLVEDCTFFLETPSKTDTTVDEESDTDHQQEESSNVENLTAQSNHETLQHKDPSPPSALNFDTSHHIYVAYTPKSSPVDETALVREISVCGSEVIVALLNHLDLFTTVQAHSRVTASFADVLMTSPEKNKSFAGVLAKDFPMFPYALLPDSLLFLLDELLSTTPQYASYFLERPLGTTVSASSGEMPAEGLIWPDEQLSSDALLQAPWKVIDCESRPKDWTLVAWLIRNMFTKFITLVSPVCCATAEWKEGEKVMTPLSGSYANTVDLNALASSTSKGGLHPTLDTMLHFSTRLLRRLCSFNPKIAQQCLLELARAIFELERRQGRTLASMDDLSHAVATCVETTDVLRVHFMKKEPLPRILFSLGVCSIASTLWGIFQLSSNGAALVHARQTFKNLRSILSSLSHMNSTLPDFTKDNALHCDSPTIQDIFLLRSCIVRLLGTLDLSLDDAQPLCRSLVRLLECLIRDPVFLLVLLGVPETLLFSCPPSTSTLHVDAFMESQRATSPPTSQESNSRLGPNDTSVFERRDNSTQQARYCPYLNNAGTSVHDMISSTIFDDLSTELRLHDYPLGLSTRPVALAEGDEEESSQDIDNGDLDDSVDEDDVNSSDGDEDIVMEEQDDVVSLSLPHEAEEHEESEAHFGLTLPRRGGSDSDSEDDDFDEEEDVPRIRGDDEDAEIMLLMPDDLSRTQLMTMHNIETDRSMQLLAEDEDDDSGTPGLLHSAERIDPEHSDEEMSNSNVTMAEDDDDVCNATRGRSDPGEDASSTHPRHEEATGDHGNASRFATPNQGTLEIVLGNSRSNEIQTSLPNVAEILSHETRDSFDSSVRPFSFEVLYTCPADVQLSSSHGEQRLNTAHRRFQDHMEETNFLSNEEEDDDDDEEDEDDSEDGEDDEEQEDGDDAEDPVEDDVDDNEMDSSLEVALPNMGTASLSDVIRLGSVGDNDNVQLNVGFDMVVLPSRAGNSSIVSLYPSLPAAFPSGTHHGVSAAASSVPTERGHQICQGNIGWTSAGDLALPSDSPVLLFPRVPRRTTGVNTGFDVIPVPSGVSTTMHAVNLPYSFQTYIHQGSNYTQFPEGTALFSQRLADGYSNLDIPSLFSLGQMLFDPWSQVAVTLLRSIAGDTSNAYSTCARAAWVRSRLWGSRNSDEYAGLNLVINNFRQWLQSEKAISCRICQAPILREEHSLVESDSNQNDPSAPLSIDRNTAEGLQETPAQEAEAEPPRESVDVYQNSPEPENEQTVEATPHTSIPQIPLVTLEDAYMLIRHEECTMPLGFRSQLIRHIALILGVTQRQLMGCLGIDVSFFLEIPDDIQTEIVLQQLPSMSFSVFQEYRVENARRLPEILSSFGPNITYTTSADTTGIRLSQVEAPAHDEVMLPIQGASELPLASADAPNIWSSTQEVPPGELMASQTSSASIRNWTVDPLSFNISRNVLAGLPREILRHSVVNSTSNSSEPSNPLLGPNRSSRNNEVLGLDNATFLGTLDTALREDLLMTATEEDLNALPAEFVAEAALLRDRARRPSIQSPSRQSQSVESFQVITPRRSYNPNGSRTEGTGDRFRVVAARHSGARVVDGRHPNGLHQLYSALFSAMQLTLPNIGSSGLHTSLRTNRSTSHSRSSGATAAADLLANNVIQDVEMTTRPTTIALPGMYTASSTSQRLIYEALDQILGDVDVSLPSVIQSSSRYESRETGVSSTRNQRTQNTEQTCRPETFSGVFLSPSELGAPDGSNHSITMRPPQDLLSCTRCSSPFDLPLDQVSVLVICRLLFLKRQVYRRDMHRLFFSLAATHKSTRHQLLQVLMVVVWNAVTDVQQRLNLPRASPRLTRLGFPPERLYSSLKLTTSLLFDSHPEAAASIAGYRALEHIRSLLEVVPSVSEFFATSMPHPAFVYITEHINPHRVMSSITRLFDNSPTMDVRRKRKKKDSGSCPYLRPFDQMTDGSPESPHGSLRIHPSIASQNQSHARAEDEDTNFEYPINVLLTLTSSKLFHTSSNHMIHLLSAIDFLLCGTRQSSTLAPTTTVSSQPQQDTEEQIPVESVTRDATQQDALQVDESSNNPSICDPGAAPMTERILNVVSLKAALTLCSLFTGMYFTNDELNQGPTFLNFYYASATHQSPFPILSRIISLLYWSPRHHDKIHQLLVSSLASLVHYTCDCLRTLKQYMSDVVARYSQERKTKPLDPTFDFLPPEHIRTPLDTSLNFLLRLVVSLQDVFWSNPSAVPSTKSNPPVRPTPAQDVSAEQDGHSIDGGILHEDNSKTCPQTDDASAVSVCAQNDRKSLTMLRDVFDTVELPKLWEATDNLLRTIEIACPFLLQRLSETSYISDADAPDSTTNACSPHPAAPTHYPSVDMSNSHVQQLPNMNTTAYSRSFHGAGSSMNDSRINLPLVVNQLLPLINSYLIAQQVTIAADLGFRASEVPRVVSQFSSTKVDTHLQQKFSEHFSQYLSNPEKTLTKHHFEMVSFCERHRKLLNLLVQNSPGILNGPFQPLVALAALCLSFENKRQYFRHSLKQLRDATRYDPIRLNVRRHMVFIDSFHQLRLRNGEEMKGKLIVHFQGEEGIDAGGLVREWYGILAKEMFNPDYALFRREGTKSEFNHPNPLSHVNPDHLCFFKFVGRVIGKAIFDGHHLASYFTRSFYKQMLGRKTSPSDAECIDPELYKSLQMLLAHKISDLGLDLRFSTDIDEFGRTQTVDLIPNGRSISVTEENKHEYVRLLCEHKISQGIRPQTESFLEGFHELIPPKFLTIFDDKEFELLISGISFVDIEDLRANTVYHSYEPTSPQIYWFWDTLAEMDQNTLAMFLQFVTGTSRVPLGGFRELMGVCGPQLFSIHRDYDDTRLPSAHTCFNQLDLPQYSSPEILKEKLLKAISEGNEGFGFA